MTVMMSVSTKKQNLIRSVKQTIMSIEKSPAHKELRNMWTVDRKAFEAQKSDQEEELLQLRLGVYHVSGVSLVVQIIIFTAIARTNLLDCSLVWSPISLSAIVGVGSMLAVAEKIYEFGIIKNEINRSDANITALDNILDELDQKGAGLDLNNSTPRAYVHNEPKAGLKEVMSWYGLSALFFLLSISIIISVFSQRTLCHNCKSCAP